MSTDTRSQRLSRRDFVKAAALMTTATVASTMVSKNQAGWTVLSSVLGQPKPLTIGVLLPRSSIYPLFGQSLLAGLQLYIEQAGGRIAGRSARLVVEEMGVGLRQAEMKSRQLLEFGNVDLVVGPLNPGLAPHLQDLLRTNKKILVATNVGANLPRRNEFSPYIFYNTLGYWQSSWLMGHWAAGNLGRRGLMAVSTYDSGYDTPYAFRYGFLAGGGQRIDTHRETLAADDDRFEGLIDQIRRTEPDFVYGLYHGEPAAALQNAYGRSRVSHVPLLGPSLMANPIPFSVGGPTAGNIKTAFSWSRDLNYPANQSFAETYAAKTGRQPDALAVLGYETGQLIGQAVETNDGDTGDPMALRSALLATELESLRGNLVIDPVTQTFQPPIYLQDTKRQSNGHVKEPVEPLKPSPRVKNYVDAVSQSLRTGWMNAYLSG